jgi:hypothetical protein
VIAAVHEAGVACHSDTTGPFSSTDITITDDAATTHEACYFGYSDARFWVTANGPPITHDHLAIAMMAAS